MAFKLIDGNLLLITTLLCFKVLNSIDPPERSSFSYNNSLMEGSEPGLNQFGSRLRRPLDLNQSSPDNFKVKSLLTSHVETQNQIHELGSKLNASKPIQSGSNESKIASSLRNPFELINIGGSKTELEQTKSSDHSQPSNDSFLQQVYSNPNDVSEPDRSLKGSTPVVENPENTSEAGPEADEEETKLRAQLQKITDKIAAVEQAEQQYQAAIETIAEYEKTYQEKINFYQSGLEKYKTDEQSLTQQQEQMEKESQELTSQIAQLQAANANLQTNIKALEESHKQINKQYDELAKSSLQLDSEDQKLRLELAKVEQNDLEYRQKYDELKRQYDALQAKKSQIEEEKGSLEKSNEVIQKQLATLQDQLKDEKETKKEIQERTIDVKDKEHSVENEIKKYENEFMALINEINNLEKLKRSV